MKLILSIMIAGMIYITANGINLAHDGALCATDMECAMLDPNGDGGPYE